jgi:SMODS and SLOG-associating 2TM effector domain family 5
MTVALSIIILVSSLLQYSSGNVANAEQHHRCALELKELHRLLLLRAAGDIPNDELRDFTGRYNAALQKYSINHSDVDFLQYQLERPEMYPWNDWNARLSIRLALAWNKHFLSLILVVMTVSMIGLVIYGFKTSITPTKHTHLLLQSLS